MSDAEEVSDAEVVPENGEPDPPAAAFSPPGEAGEDVTRELVKHVGTGAPQERTSLFGTSDPVQIIQKLRRSPTRSRMSSSART